MNITFYLGEFEYSVIRNGQTAQSPLFLVNKWNKKGQLLDVFEIEANTFKEVKDRIING